MFLMPRQAAISGHDVVVQKKRNSVVWGASTNSSCVEGASIRLGIHFRESSIGGSTTTVFRSSPSDTPRLLHSPSRRANKFNVSGDSCPLCQVGLPGTIGGNYI